ncbi:porin [Deefgea salmonis]|uniref:Porin n=1 Tax=Deefgea salmonis TaxID=2875502 RepID=A0ABS8BKW4_9NEIS|nr:porin [Deefgea salmonis]MCB5196362.1 porin [Deefgea salmonis]
MFKRVLMAVAVAAAVSAPAFAEVAISGSAEMDLFVRTNQGVDKDTNLSEEIAIVVNIDGKDKLDNGDTLKWRLAQKVATDYRYDSFGKREAWIGYAGTWGELRFGNQFTNAYLTLDWPYGRAGQGVLTSDFGAYESRWGDAISYFSPNFGGFNFTAQYKIGNTGSSNAGEGYDLGLNYDGGAFAVNAGYQYRADALVAEAPFKNGNFQTVITKDTSGDSSSVAFVGARGSIGDFAGHVLVKRNYWETNVGDVTMDQWAILGMYQMGKSSFRLGYQQMLDTKLSRGADVNDGVQQINAAWHYGISKNSEFFVQARYSMYDSGAQARKFDGGANIDWKESTVSAANNSKNNARLLVGTWTGF